MYAGPSGASQDRDRVGRHRETNTMSDRRQGITLAAVFLSVLDTPGAWAVKPRACVERRPGAGAIASERILR